jgi:polyphosphate kinase 2 (PPK2 family)
VSVIEFEHMLIRSGISLFKYYLDISRDEQASRLAEPTHNETSPWTVVDADNKHNARLYMISDLLARLTYTNKDESVLLPGKKIVKRYNGSDKKITKNH